ncbi:PHEX (predicted) [Pycnogonum litorale]
MDDIAQDHIIIKKDGIITKWWSTKSMTQKSFYLVTSLLFALFLLILIVYLSLSHCCYTDVQYQNEETKVRSCRNSYKCMRTVDELLFGINRTADPCNDFYNYMCGMWPNKYPVQDMELSSSTFQNIQRQVIDNILKILIGNDIDGFNSVVTDGARRFYNRCQDTELMENIGVDPLVALLKDLIGGWPLIDTEWKEDVFGVTDALINVQTLGIPSLMEVSVNENVRNQSEFVIMIDQPTTFSFGLDWGTLVKVPAIGRIAVRLDHYKKYIRTAAEILNKEPIYDRYTVEENIEDMVQFERLIARTIAPPGSRRNVQSLLNQTKIGEFQSKFKMWDSLELVNGLTNHVNIAMNKEDNMYPIGLPYLMELENILRATSKRTLANYFGWVIVRTFGSDTLEAFREAELSFKRSTTGVVSQIPRRRSCVTTTRQQLPFSLVREYVQRYSSFDVKAKVKAMIMEVKKSVIEGIDLLSWMDSKTKTEAKNKVFNIVDFVAYPDWVLDEKEIERRHKDVFTDLQNSKSFLQDLITTKKYLFKAKLKQLKTKPNRTSWGVGYLYPLSTNAEYDTINSIRIMIGILGDILFQEDRPHPLNYGSMGSIIGHEIIHGLDDRGSSFDQNGQLRDWWQTETKNNYHESAICIQNQYSDVTDPMTKLQLNGLNTLGENIADNGGIRQAYRAYKRNEHRQKTEAIEQLAAFTNDQLFFMSYSHTFCEDYRETYARSRIQQEPHSLNTYRVNIPLKNFAKFSEAFDCPRGTAMNPAHKCYIWI